MEQITLYPTAKINIGLYVFQKRADGFHELESIFFPVGPENSSLTPDRLTVSLGNEGNSGVVMLESGLEYPGNPEDNICVKAYKLLDAVYALPPMTISLEKHLPVGAGLGGGSSDGVCTLKAIDTLCNLNISKEKVLEFAAQLGSDCPFFVENKPMLVTGKGEVLTPLDERFGEDVVKAVDNLVKNYRVEIVFSSDCFVSTGHAYSIVPKRDKRQPYTPVTELVTRPVSEWDGVMVNDFEAPVFKEFPQLQKVKDSLKEVGASYVSMTGSGSAIYALFPR